jgi:hypothetical protein
MMSISKVWVVDIQQAISNEEFIARTVPILLPVFVLFPVKPRRARKLSVGVILHKIARASAILENHPQIACPTSVPIVAHTAIQDSPTNVSICSFIEDLQWHGIVGPLRQRWRGGCVFRGFGERRQFWSGKCPDVCN